MEKLLVLLLRRKHLEDCVRFYESFGYSAIREQKERDGRSCEIDKESIPRMAREREAEA